MKKWGGIIFIFLPILTTAQIITKYAGDGSAAYSGSGIPAIVAGIPDPIGGTFDQYGNFYFADGLNSNRIRKIDVSGVITTIAGNGSGAYGGDNGTATAAELYFPNAVRLDTSGNIYICDGANFRIRKVNAASGIITTIAGTGTGSFSGDGGPATAADIYNPQDICLDKWGNLYIADLWNNRIRKINTSGIIATIAGGGISGVGDGGPATAAQLVSPWSVAVDDTGNIYIAENSSSTLSNRVRKVDTFGIITTIAGNGNPYYSGDGIPATTASMSPLKIRFDALGQLYIADWVNYRVYRIDLGGILHLVAGNGTAGSTGIGGLATAAELNYPSGIALDVCGNLYISEPGNHDIRKVIFDTSGTALVTISASPGDTVCKELVTYTATLSYGSAISYQWYVNGSITGVTGSTYSYIPANGDSVRCVLTGVSQCSVDTAIVSSNSIYMVVNPVTVPTITLASSASAAVGSTVTVNATISGAGSSYSINWYDNGGLFNTTTVPVVSYAKAAGTDNITATVVPSSLVCYDSSTSGILTIEATSGISNLNATNAISIYPNPAHDVLTIEAADNIAGITISDVMGVELRSFVSLRMTSIQLDISDLRAGVYVVAITDEEGNKTVHKIVKE